MFNDQEGQPRLLLIDDDEGQLAALKAEIEKSLVGSPASIDVWQPNADENGRDTLIEKLKPRPALVVTDHDLTESGLAGLMGDSIIAWCRAHAIPVGDYSRKLSDDLDEPDLFEFRFSSEAGEASEQIANILKGFNDLAIALAQHEPSNDADSWSLTLANVLAHENAAGSFSLYSVRTGASHEGIISRLSKEFEVGEARRLLAIYVLGHLLHNGILKYPGPIMSDQVLCSYLAISDENADHAAEIFASARYTGPFCESRRYFWQDKVDEVLNDLVAESGVEGDPDDDHFRRAVMVKHLDPGTHPCDHCVGDRGGFRCPYTNQTKCNRPDCSVPTSSWIPAGAYLTRVDKDYYDRWSPLLGL